MCVRACVCACVCVTVRKCLSQQPFATISAEISTIQVDLGIYEDPLRALRLPSETKLFTAAYITTQLKKAVIRQFATMCLSNLAISNKLFHDHDPLLAPPLCIA